MTAKAKTQAGEKKASNGPINEMVLIRDSTSQALLIAPSDKVSSIKKGSKLIAGTIVTWRDASGERWHGPVLDIGKF